MTGISSAPHNFLTRLLGTKTYRNQKEDPTKPENLFGTDPLATTEARPTGAIPAKKAATTPAQTPTTQELAGNEQSQPQSRYQFMQMFQPQPTRDLESEETLKKRARINALGRGLGAIGALVGTQDGSVVSPYLPDTVGPWLLNQQQINDQDYRNRLQDWVNRSFEVEAYNTGVANKEIDQQIDAENAINLENLRTENDRALAEQKFLYGDQLIKSKSKEELIKEMQGMGINPNSENAYDQYLLKRGIITDADLKYKYSLTNRNNNYGTGNPNAKPPIDLDTMKKGVGVIVDDLKRQLSQANSLPFEEREATIKRINDEISFWERQYNPKTNELLNERVIDAAGRQVQASSQPQGFGDPYTPGKGFNMAQQTQQPVADPERDTRIQSTLQRVASQQASIQDLEALLQDIVDGGYAPDLATAEEYVFELINGEQQ